MSDEGIHSANAAIAANYNALVYDPIPEMANDIPRIFGLASAFGEVHAPADVLDMGCGTGTQLARAAEHAPGRLVGMDLSEVACDKARQRLVPYGERATVLCRDLLELMPADLGEFDLIYVIGVIYVVPDEVRRKILDLINHCLRPGGILQISYYAGTIPTLRANLYGFLNSAARGAASRQEAIALARQRLESLAQTVANLEGGYMLRKAIEHARGLPDVIFFHEVLNGTFAPLQTGQLEHDLARSGLSFAGYAKTFNTDNSTTSRDRALMADTLDFAGGSYHFATFAKFTGPAPGPVSAWPVAWESDLIRETRGDFHSPQRFGIAGTDTTVKVPDAPTAAAFDALIDGPLTWPEMTRRMAKALAATSTQPDQTELDVLMSNLRQMWQHGFVRPLARPHA